MNHSSSRSMMAVNSLCMAEPFYSERCRAGHVACLVSDSRTADLFGDSLSPHSPRMERAALAHRRPLSLHRELEPGLYDLERDPAEKNNLAASERRVAAAMRRNLASFPASVAGLGPIDPEDAKKLAALGYIGT